MKQLTLTGLCCLALLAAISAGCGASTQTENQMNSQAVDLRLAMRGLWNSHVNWTHMFVVSALGRLPDTAVVKDRLLKNQDDIGNAVKPYYGDAAGNQLAQLLRSHIVIAASVVKAAKANSPDLESMQAKWTANADSIADFLASANPNWSRNDLANMMHEHLRLLTNAVVARIRGNYDDEANSFVAGEKLMRQMADELTAGIVKQFPEKFGGTRQATTRTDKSPGARYRPGLTWVLSRA